MNSPSSPCLVVTACNDYPHCSNTHESNISCATEERLRIASTSIIILDESANAHPRPACHEHTIESESSTFRIHIASKTIRLLRRALIKREQRVIRHIRARSTDAQRFDSASSCVLKAGSTWAAESRPSKSYCVTRAFAYALRHCAQTHPLARQIKAPNARPRAV